MDWAKHIRRILAHLGEDVTVNGATSPAVRGMFLNPYELLTLGGEPGVASANPRLVAITADLPSAPTAVVSVRGTHNIVEVKPDDPGGYTVFELEKA